MAEKIKEINRGDYIEPAKMTIKEFLEIWLQDEVKPNRKTSTYDIYRSQLRNPVIPEIGNIPLNKPATIHIHQLWERYSIKTHFFDNC